MVLSCGSDGNPGNAYLSFTWDWYVDWYDDNNGSVPYTIYENTDYQTSPGTFTYEYGCSDGTGYFWEFYGTYTITINEGEKGGMFSGGGDGADKHFTLNLRGTGPYFSKPSFDKQTLEYLDKNKIDMSMYEITNIGEMEIETQESNGATIVITRQLRTYTQK